ncbi:hypothetical protein BVX97_00465 [bacterium E08(2017)]|nr:hypothetical protein BVX97_00465 [bacterium E08(2017)]
MHYTTALIQLPLVKESSREPIRTPDDCYRLCQDLAELAQESFQVLCLNAKSRLICREMITLGILDASLVHPREVFRGAILNGASAVVLVHNHPSGDPSPSTDDIRITKQLIEAGRIIDIKVLDHVIVGDRFVSMREDAVCRF